MRIEFHPYDKSPVIKTELGAYAIGAYVIDIMQRKLKEGRRISMADAKNYLDCMAIYEFQNKMYLPMDFEEIYKAVIKSANNN